LEVVLSLSISAESTELARRWKDIRGGGDGSGNGVGVGDGGAHGDINCRRSTIRIGDGGPSHSSLLRVRALGSGENSTHLCDSVELGLSFSVCVDIRDGCR
jgi:hypothetical protein